MSDHFNFSDSAILYRRVFSVLEQFVKSSTVAHVHGNKNPDKVTVLDVLYLRVISN